MGFVQQIRSCWPQKRDRSASQRKWQEVVVSDKIDFEKQGHNNSVPSSSVSMVHSDGHQQSFEDQFILEDTTLKSNQSLPWTQQQQLQLQTIKAPFQLIDGAELPEFQHGAELLIRVDTIGLNPIDWKAPMFGFGIPSLPCVLGRDYVGVVVKNPSSRTEVDQTRSIPIGSVVVGVSTDYRDFRKAAFQDFVVAPVYNVSRLPKISSVHRRQVSSLGVAFVTAALAFGVCLGGRLRRPGLNRSRQDEHLDLLSILRKIPAASLPEDIRGECSTQSILDAERPKNGDWIAIWGGGSTVGFLLVQLAKMAGLKIICIADAIKNGSMLVDAGADVLIHRRDHEEATDIIKAVTKGKQLRYGIDTVSKETATLLQNTLQVNESNGRKHLVGLVGLPKHSPGYTAQHKVPIKLFHECPAIGEALMGLMEELLASEQLILPQVHVHHETGLRGVISGLDALRQGAFTGHRVVVPIR